MTAGARMRMAFSRGERLVGIWLLQECVPLMQGFEEEFVVQGMHMLFTGDRCRALKEQLGQFQEHVTEK